MLHDCWNGRIKDTKEKMATFLVNLTAFFKKSGGQTSSLEKLQHLLLENFATKKVKARHLPYAL
jgi:hypothetical protein